MKTVFRFVGLSMLLAAFLAVGSTAAIAQDACEDYDANAELDAKVRENYENNETVGVAIEAGKQYIAKFGNCPVFEDFTNWVKGQMPEWEKRKKAYDEWLWLKPRTERFDAGVRDKKYDDAYAAGKEILAKYPDNMNIMVPLGVIGLYASYDKNYKHNEDTIRFAQMAIAKLKAGAKATKKNPAGLDVYGVFQHELTKEQAISEMTYALGYINFWVKNDKKSALPYYYEVSQLEGPYKNEPRVYVTIGEYYLEQAANLGKEIATLVQNQKETFETDSEEVRDQKEATIKGKIALFNGYTERAMDALSRAYKVAPATTPEQKKYRDSIYTQLQTVFRQRFDKTEGLDTWISSTIAKPMPNPTSNVEPVIDPETETETETSTSTTGGTAMARP